jgi:hypothetical protein
MKSIYSNPWISPETLRQPSSQASPFGWTDSFGPSPRSSSTSRCPSRHLLWPATPAARLHARAVESMRHRLLVVSPHKSSASSPPLQRTVTINGLHSTPTSDIPHSLTSHRPHPIKGTPSIATRHHTSCHPKLRLPMHLTASHRAPTRRRFGPPLPASLRHRTAHPHPR